MIRALTLFGLILLGTASTALLSSCRRENPSNFDRNVAPETYVSGAPAESTLSYYRVRLFWNGSDPDGVVDHYQSAVTASNKTPGEDTPEFSGYFRTDRTDSIFRFTANDVQILGHRFYVRAVDNEGKTDPTPAWSYFVAHDFTFPNVVWTRAMGFWTTSFGERDSTTIFSSDSFDPTDTIGVGGSVEYSWDGFDVDPGGSVVGFRYRPSSATSFVGGSLDDTFFSKSYDEGFSGKDALHVVAIDDALAETFPDSIRSVVINFNPVTLIVMNPEFDTGGSEPTATRVFTDDNGVVRPSGTILADGLRSVKFHYTGFDDWRDLRPEDQTDPAVVAFSWRRLENGGGQAFREIPQADWDPYPAANEFARSGQAGSQNLFSADWAFLIRCRDIYGRWGTPDTIRVGVNYPAFFAEINYVDAGGTEHPLWDPSGEIISLELPFNDGNPPPLHIRYRASDEHSADNTDPLDVSHVVEDENGAVLEYRARVNGAGGGFDPAPPDEIGEAFLPVSVAVEAGVVRPGLNRLELTVRDDGQGRTKETKITVTFQVTFQGQSSGVRASTSASRSPNSRVNPQ